MNILQEPTSTTKWPLKKNTQRHGSSSGLRSNWNKLVSNRTPTFYLTWFKSTGRDSFSKWPLELLNVRIKIGPRP